MIKASIRVDEGHKPQFLAQGELIAAEPRVLEAKSMAQTPFAPTASAWASSSFAFTRLLCLRHSQPGDGQPCPFASRRCYAKSRGEIAISAIV
ncbi:hypothetical protein DEM26_20000 [Thioclava sp. NG1]|nr:hypothetical protein DEM26_20000 [Thioclava sp. NG1]